MSDTDLTPLMRQYWEVKHAYRDAIVFFRVGDFYEMFYQDAEEASKLLDIALTSRDKARPDPVPLCGVPHHAAAGYIAKLLEAGRTVALCDQVEDPKLAKGLVRREVVRLYTPGTLTDSELLSPTKPSFLAGVTVESGPPRSVPQQPVFGLAALDLSTGEFWVMEFRGEHGMNDLRDELGMIEPRELLYPRHLPKNVLAMLLSLKGLRHSDQDPSRFEPSSAGDLLRKQFGVSSLESFGCEGLTSGLQAAGALVDYLRETQPTAPLHHVRRLQVRHSGQTMHLDHVTIRNLELLTPLSEVPMVSAETHPTLLSVLNRTVTVMGSRLIRDWIVRPLVTMGAIQARLDAVSELVENFRTRCAVRTLLKSVQDIIRLAGRISLGSANPREILALKESVATLPELRRAVTLLRSHLFQEAAQAWDDLADLYDLIEKALVPEAPGSVRDGGVIQDGYHPRLDELRKAGREGKGSMTRLEALERERSGIESLKIRYNQVFGYYIEVTKSNLARVPDRYHRKQTLTNAERFTTPELKELEDLVTGADQTMIRLEQELFEYIRDQLVGETLRIQSMGHILASLDVLASLAEVAAIHNYVKPEMSEGGTLHITEGRHPVVERLQLEGGFIPNDTFLDLDSNRFLIITGPNMAGKSTYLRQVGLIALLAHIGSFVPARTARIGLVDRIFTRVGASDNLAAGQSTFMMEMTETAKILNCATNRSLILLDEIGRGTSTYDGLSIAWAVSEYIQDKRFLGSRTLFATHYHEMTQLAALREGIKNYTVAVQDRGGEVLFLRKIVEGGADRSYGIHVAKLAGLPEAVLTRAKQVLAQLEQPPSPTVSLQTPLDLPPPPQDSLPSPHPLIEEVRQIDLFSITPLDALNRLADLQRRLEEHQ